MLFGLSRNVPGMSELMAPYDAGGRPHARDNGTGRKQLLLLRSRGL